MEMSGYRFMWVLALYDLPVNCPETRRAYTRFRNKLIKDGFSMMQFSVYIRHCASRENAEVHIKRVKKAVPARGEVRVISLTDKQFERMYVFRGKRRQPTETPPSQMEFF